jgi:hypothetical protein
MSDAAMGILWNASGGRQKRRNDLIMVHHLLYFLCQDIFHYLLDNFVVVLAVVTAVGAAAILASTPILERGTPTAILKHIKSYRRLSAVVFYLHLSAKMR